MMTSHNFGILNTKDNKESMNTGMLVRTVPVSGHVAMPQPATARWNPSAEQLMILEDMYRAGIRTPNAEQIQQITAHLSLYGKIEGKNVFYWFQNHKARDRQKLRRKMESTQEEPKSTTIYAEDTPAGMHLNRVHASSRDRDECLNSLNCQYEYEYEYEMENRGGAIANARPLKTLELFPTCSGL